MMPGRVSCLPPENLLGLSWHESAWVPMLNPTNVLDYFSERSNPFYDRTCNNELIKMQRLSPDQLVNMTGIEYMLLHVQDPILYVVRKLHRHSPTQITPLADYYIIAGVVYQAPDLASVINSRLLTSVSHLQSAFDDLFAITRYHPSKGYSWDVKSQLPPVVGPPKKEVKVEPSSNFQRLKVDTLLIELTRRFPVPVIKPPEPEPTSEAPVVKQEIKSEVKQDIKLEIKQEIKEEKPEQQSITSPPMKPPPEKKIRLG